jgi:hypothetical protein
MLEMPLQGVATLEWGNGALVDTSFDAGSDVNGHGWRFRGSKTLLCLEKLWMFCLMIKERFGVLLPG